MRICFVSSAKNWGGGEQVLASLIDGIAMAGHEVGLVARAGRPMAQWGHDRGLAILREQPGRGRSPVGLWQLRRWLSRQQFDVLLLNDPHAITSGGIASSGTKVLKIGVRHTVFPIHSAWKHNRLLDHLVCVSEAARKECIDAGIAKEKTSVVYGGVPKPPCDETARLVTRKLFQSASECDSDRHIVAVGSLLPVKGFDTLIRAVAKGVGAHQKWQLWLAGEGPERSALETLAAELGAGDRVHFLGHRTDVPELLAEADLFVSASHSEGLSLVLIEAMFAGCPIAATAVGGSREVLKVEANVEANETSPLAELFEPRDANQLFVALKKSLTETSAPVVRQRAVQAKQWAEATFSVKQMAENHLQLYQQLLDSKNDLRSSNDTNQRSEAA